MATTAQLAANRLNAIRSTGPRTVDGRAASSRNALRHGVDALSLVIPGEDPEELSGLSGSYHGHFRPQGPGQEYLVETLVHSEWLRRRYLRIEAEMLRHAVTEGKTTLAAIHLTDDKASAALERVRRHYQAAQRAWLSAYKQLEGLLSAEAEAEAAAPLAAVQDAETAPPPPEIGFVPQISPAGLTDRHRERIESVDIYRHPQYGHAARDARHAGAADADPGAAARVRDR